MATPNYFDDVPASAAEDPLKLLHDFPVTTNRAIEALKITVHNENQIIEGFTTGKGNCPQGLWLITLAIA